MLANPSRFARRHCLLERLRARLKRWISRVSIAGANVAPKPIRTQRAYVPTLRPLEARFVLNATAELNVLGQLVITGDAASDTIDFNVLANGDFQLQDGAGAVVPIINHPGFSTSPLSPSSVTSSQILIDMGGGDDILNLDLPDGFDVTVIDASGNDQVNLKFLAPGVAPASNLIDISAQTITVDSGNALVSLSNDDLELTGNVILGNQGFVSSYDLGTGDFSVVGQVQLAGDVSLFSVGGAVDFSAATLTGVTPGADAFFRLSHPATADLTLGRVDDSGGQFVENIAVVAASSVTTTDSIEIDGAFAIQGVADFVQIESVTDADSIRIRALGDVNIDGDVTSRADSIVLDSASSVRVSANLDTTSALSAGSIDLVSPSIEWGGVNAVTSGADISFVGALQIDGDVRLDTGNNSTAVNAGKVSFLNTVDSSDATNDRLHVFATGSVSDGTVLFQSTVGRLGNSVTTFDLNELFVEAATIQARDIGITAGPLTLNASNVRMLGSSWRTSSAGDVTIGGALQLSSASTLINSAESVRFLGDIVGQTGLTSLGVTAEDDIQFDSRVGNVFDLAVVSGDSVLLSDRVSVGRNLHVAAANRVDVFAPTLTSVGDTVFQSDVIFHRDALLSANQLRFDGVIDTGVGTNVVVSSPIIDPASSGEIVKRGDGRLVLTGNQVYTASTLVEAGTLTVDGVIEGGAGQLTVASGARLEGNGVIETDVRVQSGGTIAPGIQSGDPESGFSVHSLVLELGSNYEMQISGLVAGIDYDSLVVGANNLSDESVVLDGAILDLTLNTPPPPATEFVLVDNDGDDAIVGRLQTNRDINGNLLATPRTLVEGDLVVAPVGAGATPAFITYFGGDGNDITLVTPGDVTIASAGVTLVTRLGADIEIRTGGSLATARSAAPTVRPISGLNNNELTIVGTTNDDTVFIDIDGFVDSSGASVNFDGNIQFNAGEDTGDMDRLVIFDSDPSSVDIPDALSYAFLSGENAIIQVDTPLTSPDYSIGFDSVELVDQLIESPIVSIEYTEADETIAVRADSVSPSRTLFSSSGNGLVGTDLSIVNPTASLTVKMGAGSDKLSVDSFGTSNGNYQAPLTLVGDAGVDTVEVNADLNLGVGSVSGNLMVSAEVLTISGSITTTGGLSDGNVNLVGGTAITLESGAAIFVGDAVIDVDGNGGVIDTSEGDLSSAFRGDAVLLRDASNILVGDIDVTSGTLRIGNVRDVSGSVTQNPNTRIVADRFTASTSGPIDFSNPTNDFRLVEEVQSGGEFAIRDAIDDLTMSRIDSNGNDVTAITNGTLRLSNQAVLSIGATTTLSADAAIIDIDMDDSASNITAGTIELVAGLEGIGQNGTSVDVVATETVNASTAAFAGDINLANRFGAMLVGLIDAGAGDVVLQAITIDDASADAIRDLIGDQLTLTADQGIGVLQRLELHSVNDLVATTETGGIDLDWVATQRTTIRLLDTQNGDIQIVQSGGHALDVEQVQNQTGSVRLVNADQSIDVLGSTPDTVAILVGGLGDIDLNAQGDSSDLFVRNEIRSAAGAISFAADRNVVFSQLGDVTSSSNTIVIRADERNGSFGGAVSIDDGALIDAGDGVIDVATDGDIEIGGLRSTNTTDAIRVTSTSGRFTDAGDQHLEIDANAGAVTLQSRTGIGDANALETAIGRLSSEVSGSGSTRLIETDAIELTSVRTNDGLVDVNAAGTITAIFVETSNVNAEDDAGDRGRGSRDIYLTTTDSESDIRLDQITAGNGADVFLVAADDIVDRDSTDGLRVVADDLFILAGNSSNDADVSVDLSTTVNDLELSVTGVTRGDAEIRETDSLNLAASDRADDLERLFTANGEIRVFAEQSIRTRDLDPTNEGSGFGVDPELIAGGENGRVQLRSADTIVMGNAVQFQASQSTIDAVLLESDLIDFGENIEINTGAGIGVARVFAPRPGPGLVDTAFYESTSVTTNILEQAAINDAEGRLTVDIGNEGERGLTINIDWGAEAGRFQQIDDLSGDAPPLVVSHVYLESDILNSRLNGRVSETKPLNVKFAVRHHESIRVLGSTVTQNGSEIEVTEGLVVSSTDNPLTAQSEQVQILENGTASFLIPSLSIPVAFFPVRDVIPAIDEPEVFVRAEQAVATTLSTVEDVESSVSSSVSRQEYFQIRVLSADPNGSDLVPPKRLPDDILDGDKLRELFKRLPDGPYEIEYVLGDGNERSILRVDLRGGEPIIPGDELDGGPLKLRLIEDGDDENTTENNAETSNVESGADVEGDVHTEKKVERARELLRTRARLLQSSSSALVSAGVETDARDDRSQQSERGPSTESILAGGFAAETLRRGREARPYSAFARFLSRVKPNQSA